VKLILTLYRFIQVDDEVQRRNEDTRRRRRTRGKQQTTKARRVVGCWSHFNEKTHCNGLKTGQASCWSRG